MQPLARARTLPMRRRQNKIAAVRISPSGGAQALASPRSVTAPSEALLTSAAYLASTPCVAYGRRWRPTGPPPRDLRVRARAASALRCVASMLIRSPSRTSASGPPTAASGDTCPTTKPWLPPEKRPSVISATSVAQALAHDRRRRREHFAHARSALRPFVAHDQHVARHHCAVEDRLQRGLLAVEHAGPALERRPSLPVILATAPAGARLPYSTTRWLSGLIGSASGRTIAWPAGYGFTRFEVLRQGLAGDRQAVAVQQAGAEHALHQRLDAADADQLGHRVLAAGPQVGQHRHPGADAREVVESSCTPAACAIASRCSTALVEPAERDGHHDRVLERLARHDVRGLEAALDQFHHRLAGALGVESLGCAKRASCAELLAGSCPAPRSPRPWCWPCTCRRKPGSRDRSALDLPQLAIGDRRRAHAPHGLEHGDDVASFPRTRADRAAIDEDRRAVQPRDGHHAARACSCRSRRSPRGRRSPRADHGLDRIRDHLARHERIPHARACPSRCRRKS